MSEWLRLGLRKEIVRGLRELGFTSPTPIQRKAIPVILSGRNALLISPTGSGKTEASLLPVLNHLLEESEGKIRALYVTPLRALNRDLLNRLTFWAENLGVDIQVRHGDTSQHLRRKQLKKPPQILITTPETFQILLCSPKLRKKIDPRFLIVDEVHEIFSSKRGTQMALGIRRLKVFKDFQLIGLSATLANELPILKALFEGDCEVVRAGGPREYSVRVLLLRDPEKRLQKLREIIEKERKVIIFTNTRETAERIASSLLAMDLNVGVHHSSLSREKREEVEGKFKKGEIQAIVATSSMELGIDIGDVTFVVQYSSPRQVRKLIQRVGRASHSLRKKARGLVLTGETLDYFESLACVKLMKKGYLEDVEPPREAMDVLAHQLVGLVLEHGKISIEEAYRILKHPYLYERLDFGSFEELTFFLRDLGLIRVESGTLMPSRKSRIYYFENVSMIPEERRIAVKDVAFEKKIAELDLSFAMELEEGDVFICAGKAWKIVSFNETIFVEPFPFQIGVVPIWTGEMIPVSYAVARESFKRAGGNPKIEIASGILVFHFPFGDRVNEVFEKAISHELRRRKLDFYVYKDPYFLAFYLGFDLTPDFVKEILDSAVSNFETNVLEELERSRIFLWKFMQVARRFGILRKGVEVGKEYLKKLIEIYRDTPVYKEAINDAIWAKMDLEKAKALKDLVSKLPIEKKKKISGICARIFARNVEILPLESYIQKVKEEIMEKLAGFLCLYCGKKFYMKVREVEPLTKCPSCGSTSICLLKDEYLSERKKAFLVSDLIKEFGKYAVAALLIGGVGPATLKRIVRGGFLSEEEFFSKVLEAKKEYLRTRGYWQRGG